MIKNIEVNSINIKTNPIKVSSIPGRKGQFKMNVEKIQIQLNLANVPVIGEVYLTYDQYCKRETVDCGHLLGKILHVEFHEFSF